MSEPFLSQKDAERLPKEIVLQWNGMTHPGRFRKNNEDAFLALSFDSREVRYLGKLGSSAMTVGDFVFAVSDGMGGANAGEFASRIAVQKIAELLPRSFKLGAMGVDRGFSDILAELFQRIHKEMTQMAAYYEECEGMGATLSLCWFAPGWLHFCHVGDSRIYYLPAEGGIRQLTEDHSHVGSLYRAGKLNEREAKQHPQRHVLDQVLGGKTRHVTPQYGKVNIEPGDRFLLCTDGVNDGVWDRRIDELLRQPPARFVQMNPALRLITDSLEESGRDNLTAVVVEVL